MPSIQTKPIQYAGTPSIIPYSDLDAGIELHISNTDSLITHQRFKAEPFIITKIIHDFLLFTDYGILVLTFICETHDEVDRFSRGRIAIGFTNNIKTRQSFIIEGSVPNI